MHKKDGNFYFDPEDYEDVAHDFRHLMEQGTGIDVAMAALVSQAGRIKTRLNNQWEKVYALMRDQGLMPDDGIKYDLAWDSFRVCFKVVEPSLGLDPKEMKDTEDD